MSLANCNKHLHAHGKPNPRTCAECQLGPCKYPDGFFKTVTPEEAEGIVAVHSDDPTGIPKEKWSHVITSCSVRVMRSFDYCHFEVVLGGESESMTTKDVDDLRKHAARLADKAVAQYQAFKKDEEERMSAGMYQNVTDIEEIGKIKEKNEADRTVYEMARLKAYTDRQHRLNRDRYDYQDDWED